MVDFALPLLEFINIPTGTIQLEGYGSVEVAPFAIAKYPVTNEQFQAFVLASDGYTTPQWWTFSEIAQVWHTNHPNAEKPYFKGTKQPRELVCWYEAVAFAQWLSCKTGLSVTLPTEMQWQWAAQGESGNPYPYGGTYDARKCNTVETNIFQTSYVDQYPNGQSVFGVFDMAGNVFEWCLNTYADPFNADLAGNFNRVVKGGSWVGHQSFARVTYRDEYEPDRRYNYLGFRVAVSMPVSTT